MNSLQIMSASSTSSVIRPRAGSILRVADPILKRSLDLLVSSAALLIFSPVFMIIALLIRRDERGPVLFRQKRVGKDGVLFDMYKFRSMTLDAEKHRAVLQMQNLHGQENVTFKMKDDPRITRVGRWLRRTSLDELPQLWNVLKGDMSLVGPRPPLPSEYALYTDYQRTRMCVVPGLTCLWQVSGRADLPFETQVELDREYIARRSFFLDVKLLLLTIPAVLSGRGAY
jgi:lipopolysaccharide/colanic/teichoic acid biosynthesis glycosyltransferase